MPKELKLTSRDLLVGPDRAPARAMLKAVGFTDEDLSRPIIGVALTPGLKSCPATSTCADCLNG